MIKREIKVNFKSFLVWFIILTLIIILVSSMYPSLMSGEQSLSELIKVFPEEVLKAFNMDIADISTISGWFKTEGIVFILLFYGIFAANLGSNILAKETNDKTIEFLYSKPVSKSKILNSKIIVSLFYILLLNLLITIITCIGLYFNNDLELTTIITLNLVTLIPTVLLFFITLLISLLKNGSITFISYGILFVSYFLYTFSKISENIEFLKYFSIFTLSDIRNIIVNNSYNIICLIISIFFIVILYACCYFKYERKEF